MSCRDVDKVSCHVSCIDFALYALIIRPGYSLVCDSSAKLYERSEERSFLLEEKEKSSESKKRKKKKRGGKHSVGDPSATESE